MDWGATWLPRQGLWDMIEPWSNKNSIWIFPTSRHEELSNICLLRGHGVRFLIPLQDSQNNKHSHHRRVRLAAPKAGCKPCVHHSIIVNCQVLQHLMMCCFLPLCHILRGQVLFYLLFYFLWCGIQCRQPNTHRGLPRPGSHWCKNFTSICMTLQKHDRFYNLFTFATHISWKLHHTSSKIMLLSVCLQWKARVLSYYFDMFKPAWVQAPHTHVPSIFLSCCVGKLACMLVFACKLDPFKCRSMYKIKFGWSSAQCDVPVAHDQLPTLLPCWWKSSRTVWKEAWL